MNRQPPNWANKILEWYCDPDLLEDLQGDLFELYFEKCEESSQLAAQFSFIWYVLRSFRPSVVRKTQNTYINMTRNNLKIGWRVIMRDKFNSAINVIGLSIGITCFILMGFYVQQELSYDQFHSKKERIYRVWLKEIYGEDQIFFNSTTPLVFEKTFKESFDALESVVQYNESNFTIGEGENKMEEKVSVISPDALNVFDFTFVAGNLESAFKNKQDLIISQRFSKKYFGEKSALGQSLIIEMGDEPMVFEVTAVFKEFPKQSSLQCDIVVSNLINESLFSEESLNAWFNVGPETYVLVKEKANIATVEASTQDFVMQHLKGRVEKGEYNIGFQPLTDIHLNKEIPVGIAAVGNAEYVKILGIICVLVLLTACVNFTTLSIGQSIKRTKEVGVRKVMGAMKNGLVTQYLHESLLVTFFSLLLGVALSYVLLPFFNGITGADVNLSFEWWHLLLYGCMLLTIGVLSGLYPAFVLSSYKASNILSGHSKIVKSGFFRKGIMALQFMITVFLITSTLVMNQQLNFLHTKDLGYDYHAIVSLDLNPAPGSGASGLPGLSASAIQKGNQLKERLEQYEQIKDVGHGSHVFGTEGWGRWSYTDEKDVFREFNILQTDAHYLNTFKIKVVQGRDFDPNNETDATRGILINKAAVSYFGLKDPIGSQLPGDKFGDHVIVGVTEDFNFESLHQKISPLVITQNLTPIISAISDFDYNSSPIPKLVFRFEGSNLSNLHTIIEKEWDKTFPEEEMVLSFVDQNLQFLYEGDNKMKSLVFFATILSILIASLGLLGLTVLVVNGRLKEISIRKVIGASQLSIFGMLGTVFIRQLAMGILLSIPITYWFVSDWLEGFAYHIEVGPMPFVIGGLVSFGLAMVVIVYHTIKAANVNPVDRI